MTGKLKFAIYGLLAVIFIIAAVIAYRLFFMFDRKKVSAYATNAAANTADPNKAYQFIIEITQSILKSQDLTAAVLLLADVDKIEKEQALVLTALNRCYSLGFLERPDPNAAVVGVNENQ